MERTRIGAKVSVVTRTGNFYTLLLPEYEKYITKLARGAFYSISELDVRSEQKEMRLKKSSRIFKSSEFELGDLDTFYHAPSGSIADAHASPAKKRMSVSGLVTKIYPGAEGDGWRRKDVIMKDTDNTSQKITK